MRFIAFIRSLAIDYGLAVVIIVVALAKKGMIELSATESTLNVLGSSVCIIFVIICVLKCLEMCEKIKSKKARPGVWVLIDLVFTCIMACVAIIALLCFFQ
jgi:hypothetical protein